MNDYDRQTQYGDSMNEVGDDWTSCCLFWPIYLLRGIFTTLFGGD